VKSSLQNVKTQYQVCVVEGTNARASGIRGYFPQLQKYEDFWGINSMLKESYCVFLPPLDVFII
jgi:PP-loop superfamily ATP-utilizing enzyme